jgi:uncharacterized damage-inducible protein DinB
MQDLRYPIGEFTSRKNLSSAEHKTLIAEIAAAPSLLRRAIEGLDDRQLDTPYRPGGWTVRQVVHHVPDSHLNAYIRFKLGMTEDHPTIKPYDQDRWSEFPEARTAPPELSLKLLESLHQRWVLFLEGMQKDDFRRTLLHPESGIMTLSDVLQLYAWHGKHHTAHITSLRQRMGW